MSKTIEKPATEAVASTALFAVIDEDAFEKIQEIARRLYLKSQPGCRGQQLTMQDSHDYWIMVATREFLSANLLSWTVTKEQASIEDDFADEPIPVRQCSLDDESCESCQ